MDSHKYNKYSRFTKDLNSFPLQQNKAPYSNSEVCMSTHKGDVQDYNNTFRIIGASSEPSVEPYSLGGPSFSRWWVSCKSVDSKYSLPGNMRHCVNRYADWQPESMVELLKD